MTSLTDFQVTDDTTDNLASYHNRLLGGILYSKFSNTETISATKELADADCQFQIITASGANRTVELPPEADTNHFYIIFNTGASNNVVVKDDSGSITFMTLAPGEWALFVPIYGEAWQVIESRVTLKTYFDTLYGTVTLTGTQTLTNKRITRRIVTVTQSATPSINTDNGDVFNITGLAQAITSLTTNLTGTPTDEQTFILNVTDDGTGRTIAPGASFAGTANNTLTGLTTVANKKLILLWKYSSALSKWELVGKDQSL